MQWHAVSGVICFDNYSPPMFDIITTDQEYVHADKVFSVKNPVTTGCFT